MTDLAVASPLSPFADLLSALRSERSDFERTTSSLFGELDTLRQRLAQQSRELGQKEQRLAERETELQHQREETERFAQLFERQEAKLAQALEELQALRQELDQSPADAALESLQQQLQTALAERASLQEQLQSQRDKALAQAVSQIEHLSEQTREALSHPSAETGESSFQPALEEILAKLNELRQAISEEKEHPSSQQFADIAEEFKTAIGALQAETASLARSLESASSGEGTDYSADFSELKEICGRLDTAASALASAENGGDRQALETELELLRTRAAELQLALEEQQQEAARERQRVGEELKQLRLAFEQYVTTAVVSPVASKNNDSQGDDPVAESVMAQFEKLQKEIAQRRKQKSHT